MWSGRYPGNRISARRTIGHARAGPLTHARWVTASRLRALFASQGVALGLLMPFLVPILVDRGMGPAEIGLALGASGLASLLAYPTWGVIADGWLGRRSTIALASVTAAPGGLLILVAGSDPVAITLALSVAMVGALPWGPLIDALTLQELDEPSAGQVASVPGPRSAGPPRRSSAALPGWRWVLDRSSSPSPAQPSSWRCWCRDRRPPGPAIDLKPRRRRFLAGPRALPHRILVHGPGLRH